MLQWPFQAKSTQRASFRTANRAYETHSCLRVAKNASVMLLTQQLNT